MTFTRRSRLDLGAESEMLSGATIDFVKGHCGWDVVTLVPEGQIPKSAELEAAIKILSAPVYGGLEVGFMGFGARPGEIALRIVNSTTKNWIPMCGGMTQVIGKALVETFMRDYFRVDASWPVLAVNLVTESGTIPIRIDVENGKVSSVMTTMDSYVSYAYRTGVEPLSVRGVPLLRVGKFAVLDVAALETVHPGVDFTRRSPGPHLEIVNDILRAYKDLYGWPGANGMLYDDRPEGGGQYRVFPRFYSDDLAAAAIPWEFQCGTGSIAVSVALAFAGRLPFATRQGELALEWGSYRSTRDPYGIRTSRLELEVDGQTVEKAAFSHSVIEIVATGKLTLPVYRLAPTGVTSRVPCI